MTVIITTGTANSGIFVYNGTPTTGNLVGSWTAQAGTDVYGNVYGVGLTIGETATSHLLLNPNASNTFGTGSLEAVLQSFTDDPQQMMPSMLGSLIFNGGLTDAQMAAVYHTPIPTGKNGYALVLSADSNDGTIASNLSVGTVTTDGVSMNYTAVVTVDASGNVIPNSVVTYGSKSSTVTTVTFTTAGSHTFTVPTGVTTLKVECWGAGGGGQGGSGGGGGGGEYAAEATLAVTAGNSYAYTVGAGGAGGPGGVGGPGVNGGNTTFAGDSVTVTAHGGNGSTSATTLGGTGSTNATHFDGGGSHANTTGTSTGGAGGGSSAGTVSVGTSGTSNSGSAGGPGGVAPTGGGDGGAGGNGSGSSGVPGVDGSSPGGGGGTGGAGSSSNSAGGAGANGQVRVTYTVPASSAVSGSVSAVQFTDSQGNTIPRGLMGRLVAVQSGSSPQVPATWQAPSFNANWATSTTFNGLMGYNGLQFRLDGEDNVWIVGAFQAGAVTPSNPVFVLPVGYRPQAGSFPIFCQTDNGGTLLTGHAYVSTTGNLDLFTAAGSPVVANAQYLVNGKVPLGNLA